MTTRALPADAQVIVTIFASLSLPETCGEAYRKPLPSSATGHVGFGASLGRALCANLQMFARRPLAPYCAPFVLRQAVPLPRVVACV